MIFFQNKKINSISQMIAVLAIQSWKSLWSKYAFLLPILKYEIFPLCSPYVMPSYLFPCFTLK